jgi:hypothetical protein
MNLWGPRGAREPPECELPDWSPSNVTIELLLDYLEDMVNNWDDAPAEDAINNGYILDEIAEEAMFLLARQEETYG